MILKKRIFFYSEAYLSGADKYWNKQRKEKKWKQLLAAKSVKFMFLKKAICNDVNCICFHFECQLKLRIKGTDRLFSKTIYNFMSVLQFYFFSMYFCINLNAKNVQERNGAKLKFIIAFYKK